MTERIIELFGKLMRVLIDEESLHLLLWPKILKVLREAIDEWKEVEQEHQEAMMRRKERVDELAEQWKREIEYTEEAINGFIRKHILPIMAQAQNEEQRRSMLETIEGLGNAVGQLKKQREDLLRKLRTKS